MKRCRVEPDSMIQQMVGAIVSVMLLGHILKQFDRDWFWIDEGYNLFNVRGLN